MARAHLVVFAALLTSLSAGCHTAPLGAADEATAALDAGTSLQVQPAGRYLGFARLPGPVRLPATLDLVAVNAGTARPAYRAILTLTPGGFAGHEYASVYFADVSFAPQGGVLRFAGGPDGMTLAGATLAGGVLRATLGSARDGASVALELHAGAEAAADVTAAVFAGMPLAQTVTGTYRGTCQEHPVGLQIEASKWRTSRQPEDGGLFGAYRLTGRFSEESGGRCAAGALCVTETYTAGTYNLLSGQLELKPTKSSKAAKACTLRGGEAHCGACALTRDPAVTHAVVDAAHTYQRHPREVHLPEPPAGTKATARPGQYYGYLHHEGRDIYQLVALNVKTEAAAAAPAGAQREQASAVASLYFGEGDSSEFIAYRFKDVMLPPAGRGGSGRLVLDGDGEVFVVVDAWDSGIVQGTWYSKTYGRVGTVELQQGGVPEGAADAVDRLSGVYRGSDWDFELAAAAGVSDDADDFYPLKLYGVAREKLGNAHNRAIEEGTYDFYTGAVAFRLDDGRMAIGKVTRAGMQVAWPPKLRLGMPLTDAPSKLFQRQGETFQAVAPTLHRW